VARHAVLLLLLAVAGTAEAGTPRCAPDAVAVGALCVDRVEASVWAVPQGGSKLVGRIRRGVATLRDLRSGGAAQVGTMSDSCVDVDYGAAFPTDGQWTAPLYAAAVPGVLPSTCITWLQAEQACRLAGKRLLTSREWQAAAAGTPDPGAADDGATTCATFSTFGAATGSRTDCVSAWGARDMIGNAWEWVADWRPVAGDCTQWDATMGEDFACYVQTSTPIGPALAVPREAEGPAPGVPAGLIRGGNFGIGVRSGAFAIYAGAAVTSRSRSIGFRCAR
jgi:formylglycine-generating enzyme required for sulfatase activity